MDWMIQLFAALVGSAGFSLLFNVEKRYLIIAALGGFLAWGTYLVCDLALGLNFLISTVVAAAVGQIYGEILARACKTPTTCFVIPAMVPLIPGGALYRTMYSAVFRNWDQFRLYGTSTLLATLGIAVGLSLVSGMLYIFRHRGRLKKT